MKDYIQVHEPGVHIIPFSIPFGINKFERNGGKFLFYWGHFFKLGANVLVEFENIFFNWGHFLHLGAFFYICGNFFQKLGQNIILGSRKSDVLGILWTPELY